MKNADEFNINYETLDFENNVELWQPHIGSVHKCVKRLRNSIEDFEFDSALLTVDGELSASAKDILNVVAYFSFFPQLKTEARLFDLKFYFKHTPSGRMAYCHCVITAEMFREDHCTAEQLINNRMRSYFEGLAKQVKDEQAKPLIEIPPGVNI